MDPNSALSPEPMLDHALLVAGAAVSQASTPTAELAGRMARQSTPATSDAPITLADLFATGSGCSSEVPQRSFHPRVARAASGKTSSTLMKPGFTLAF